MQIIAKNILLTLDWNIHVSAAASLSLFVSICFVAGTSKAERSKLFRSKFILRFVAVYKKTVNPTLFICVVDKTALKTEKNEKTKKK
jgi:hypothetical protein